MLMAAASVNLPAIVMVSAILDALIELMDVECWTDVEW